MMRLVTIFSGLLFLGACTGTTGGDIVDFPVAAAGPVDADPKKPFEFTTDAPTGTSAGWHVVLTQASLHIGALYLNSSEPVSGAQNTSCVLPGTYVAQMTAGMDIDLLSPTPQIFPTLGHGTTLDAIVGQVWLTGGDIATIDDPTPILTVTGTADQNGVSYPFTGKITISNNRFVSGGALAGANPICKQRIVSPIPLSLHVEHTGGLFLRIDPRFLFVNVDFSTLGKFSTDYEFSDDPTAIDPGSPSYYSQASINLYENLHSAHAPGQAGLYSFSWDFGL